MISESCYKGTSLQSSYRKMTIPWSFPYNSFVNFHGKKIIWEPQHEHVISDWCYNEVHYIGTALYKVIF